MPDCTCGATIYAGDPITGEPHATDCPFREYLRHLAPVPIRCERYNRALIETLIRPQSIS